MEPILAMTWDELQTTVLAGITVAGVVIPALIVLILRLIPQIALLKAALETLQKQSDKQGEKIDDNAKTLTQVALNTPTTSVADAVTLDAIRKSVDELKNAGGKNE
jgi:hypothetical protein